MSQAQAQNQPLQSTASTSSLVSQQSRETETDKNTPKQTAGLQGEKSLSRASIGTVSLR